MFLKILYLHVPTGGDSRHFRHHFAYEKFDGKLASAGNNTFALTRKRRCGLTVTRTFLTFFFSWKSKAEQTVGSTETSGNFLTCTAQNASVLVCDLLHRLLDLLHDGAVQHLQLTGRPADGAHWVALQPRRDLRNLLCPVRTAVELIHNFARILGVLFDKSDDILATILTMSTCLESLVQVNSSLELT